MDQTARTMPFRPPALHLATIGRLLAWSLVLLLFRPTQAQHPTDFEPADTSHLRTFLPEQFGDYRFAQTSVPPFGQEERTDLNTVYEAEDGRTLFVVLSHFPPGGRTKPGVEASAATFHGQPAFEEPGIPRLTVHIGPTVEAVSYGVAGDVRVEDLYAALEALDKNGIGALAADAEPVEEPVAEAEVVPMSEPIEREPAAPAPVTDEQQEGCAFSEAYSEEAAREFGMQLAPWTKALTPDQAMAAEVEDERLTFAREGSPWLGCVAEQDILWAPQAPDYGHVFLRRVLEIEERPDAVVFHTRNAGLNELILRGRIEVEVGDEAEVEVIEE